MRKGALKPKNRIYKVKIAKKEVGGEGKEKRTLESLHKAFALALGRVGDRIAINTLGSLNAFMI